MKISPSIAKLGKIGAVWETQRFPSKVRSSLQSKPISLFELVGLVLIQRFEIGEYLKHKIFPSGAN
ncbi:MAG: hypothetical protein ABJN14_16920 [Paracoccaceae bacterium]